MNSNDLKSILDSHKKWLLNQEGGQRADLRVAVLSGADLRNADLSGAVLSGAVLRNVDLRNADLSGADLRNADLSGADLRNADLSGADLRNADLSGAVLSGGDAFAQTSFTGHGACGRMLSALRLAGEVTFFCGCFKGDEYALRSYIENGKPEMKKSRIFALETCIKALEFTKS